MKHYFTKLFARLLAGVLAGGLLTVISPAISLQAEASEVELFPGVTQEMTGPAYWAALQEIKEPGSAAKLRASSYTIEALNQAIIDTPGCNVTDLTKVEETFDADKLLESFVSLGKNNRSYYTSSGAIYDINGNVVGDEFYDALTANKMNPLMTGTMHVRYGICTKRTDLRSEPTVQILTDAVGDVDFDYFQMAAVRVNEPVVVKVVSTDGQWYYCVSSCCEGWVRSSDIALCKTRQEWLDAWNIPAQKVLVVTSGKIYLEQSNKNPDISGRMLTMGTTLRIAESWEYTTQVTNRSAIQNYAVWMPVRDRDGYYSKKVALISQHQGVHAGYLPLTTQNILDVAFSMLGDAYGWGAMLDSVDCSSYLRDIYKCFGLELPRNTTWQSAMPVVKCDMSQIPQNVDGDVPKKALLDTCPPGTLLYFSGHTMMYLGHVGDEYYVISSVSSMADPETGKYMRVRSVLINTLNAKRLSGKTWLNCLNMALIPYER